MHVDTVLLKVASRCNLDCGYCYVYHMGDESWQRQPKRMSSATQSAIAERLQELLAVQGRAFSVVLHGGEPLLLGASGLDTLLEKLRQALGDDSSISIQTNGVLLDAAILDVCVDRRVSLSISLDGPADVHDRFRTDRSGRPPHARVEASICALQQHRHAEALFSGVLAVVDPTASPDRVYDYFHALDVPSADFLYRDGNYTTLPHGKSTVDSTEYGRWMARILDRYVMDPAPFRIRMLDDMMRLALGGVGVKEGIGLTDYGILIIDTDGSVKKNDTLKSSPPGDTFSRAWSVHGGSLAEIAASEEFQAYHRAQRPTSQVCARCPHLRICGGGMATHRYSDERGYDNPTVFCTDQTLVIERMLGHVGAHVRAQAA